MNLTKWVTSLISLLANFYKQLGNHVIYFQMTNEELDTWVKSLYRWLWDLSSLCAPLLFLFVYMVWAFRCICLESFFTEVEYNSIVRNSFCVRSSSSVSIFCQSFNCVRLRRMVEQVIYELLQRLILLFYIVKYSVPSPCSIPLQKQYSDDEEIPNFSWFSFLNKEAISPLKVQISLTPPSPVVVLYESYFLIFLDYQERCLDWNIREMALGAESTSSRQNVFDIWTVFAS